MKILSTAIFSGPSIFAPVPVIYLKLDLDGLEAWPSVKLGPAFKEALLGLLPGLGMHGAKQGEFAARLSGKGAEKEGLPFALLLGHVAGELERLTSALGRPRGAILRGKGRHQEIFFGYEDEDLAREASRVAPELLMALLPAEARAGLKNAQAGNADPAELLRAFLQRVESWTFDPTTKLLLRAAAKRGIPWQRLTPRSSRVALGQGRWRRIIQAGLTDVTPATSALVAADKEPLGTLLRDLGLPVPAPQPEAQAKEPSADQAAATASGEKYRLLVIGGHLVLALRLDKGPRGARQTEAVVTEAVHPLVREMAEHAALSLRLDSASLRYRARDIALPPDEAQGVFLNIDSAAKLDSFAAAAPELDLPGRIIDRLFPKGGSGRVPLAAITGTNGKTTTTRMLARILEVSGLTTGIATTDGAYIGGKRFFAGDVAGKIGVQAVLADPRVQAAVLESARGGLLSNGATFGRCDVAAITNVTSDHLGIGGVETLEQMARVKRLVAESARGRIVLNADDASCRDIAAGYDPQRLCYVTLEQDNPAVVEHLRRGGAAVVLGPEDKSGMIVVIENGQANPLMPKTEIPATLEGAALHNAQNAMFATAMARGLGISMKTIREALSGFENSFEMSMGRLNIYDGHPFTVMIDYAHNPDGFRVVGEALKRRYPERRRVAVVTTLGCRHPEQIAEGAGYISGLFDRFVCGHDDTYSLLELSEQQRGFPAGEIPERIAAALATAGVPPRNVVTAGQFPDPVQRALEMAEAGDVLAIFTDEPRRTLDIVKAYTPSAE